MLAGVTAIAIRVSITHAALVRIAAAAGGLGALPSRRETGGAGLAGPAAFVLHLLAGRVARGAGLARHRPFILHALSRCIVLRPVLGIAERRGREQQTRRGDDR